MEEGCCATRYPVLFIHGTGFRDRQRLGYWGRIPQALQARGARVFFGGQDSWATVEQNAALLKQRLEEVLAETGAEKVHLIAHSKGGLEARYLVSSLGMAGQVTSVQLIGTPNRGSRTMDRLYRLPRWAFRLAGFFVNGWFRLLGDRHPDFCTACFQFTTAWAETFNAENPDVQGILYRSYAGVMDSCRSDVFMSWQNFIIGLVEGPNDGLVTLESALWTGFQGPWRGVGGRGVSHMDLIDFRRRPLRWRGRRWDVVDAYVQIVAELRQWEQSAAPL
ncbi:triacylglycerol lipase [uncultured Subdoligranulum sp.]|uniref:esterase/lipase family protein n=1 Tax=uncultured Subdoligranulum sp. TaxID=512298 RepID=UPI002618A722|nr:hypothetical protein [uncultured Subdoligranulum sp.]